MFGYIQCSWIDIAAIMCVLQLLFILLTSSVYGYASYSLREKYVSRLRSQICDNALSSLSRSFRKVNSAKSVKDHSKHVIQSWGYMD